MQMGKLVLTEPFKPARHIIIDKNPFYIGRGAECDLILDRTSISKSHSRIRFDGEHFVIEDLQSKNGILVNGTPVPEKVLQNEDLISLGGVDLRFQRIKTDEVNAELEKGLTKFKSAMQFAQSIGSNQILDKILDETMEAVMRLTQAERGFLLVQNEKEKLEMARSVNIASNELNAERSGLSYTAVNKCVESRKSIAISNALDDTYFGDQSSVQDLELKTLVCVPVLVEEDKVSAIIYADSSRKEQEFTQLDVEVLESLAANVGIAMENARLNQDVWNLVFETSDVLAELDGKAQLDDSLQSSVQNALKALSHFRKRRKPPKVNST